MRIRSLSGCVVGDDMAFPRPAILERCRPGVLDSGLVDDPQGDVTMFAGNILGDIVTKLVLVVASITSGAMTLNEPEVAGHCMRR